MLKSINFFKSVVKSVVHNLQLIQNKVHTSADVSWGYLERFGKSTFIEETEDSANTFFKRMDFN